MHKHIRTEHKRTQGVTYHWPLIWLVWDCETIHYFTDGKEGSSWSEEIARLDLRWVIALITLIILFLFCS